MSTGIYLIHNRVNGHNYIGQSVNIERRLASHKRNAFNPSHNSYDLPLYRAIRKYGIENFDFLIVELCDESELNKKEIEHIKKFNAYSEGYNSTLGGGGRKLEKTETVRGIISDLEDTFMSHKEIAIKWGVNVSTVSWINEGIMWRESRTYPIQSPFAYLKRKGRIQRKGRTCKGCGSPISGGSDSGLCRKCSYQSRRKVDGIDRDVLKMLIRVLPMTNIGMLFGVSDNAVRKWCKSLSLPYSSKLIKELSNEEWDKL